MSCTVQHILNLKEQGTSIPSPIRKIIPFLENTNSLDDLHETHLTFNNVTIKFNKAMDLHLSIYSVSLN